MNLIGVNSLKLEGLYTRKEYLNSNNYHVNDRILFKLRYYETFLFHSKIIGCKE